MKKFISIIFLLCFVFTNAGYAQIKTAGVTKGRITQEQGYSYIDIDWWKNFNDENLINYINKAFEENNDAKMATFATEEYYQAAKLQFSQELPQVGAGFAPVYYKLPVLNNYDWRFFFPVAANYEADFFLKNHDKTKSAQKTYKMSLQDEKSVYISVAAGVAAMYINLIKLDNIIEIQNKIVNDRKTIYELTSKCYERGLVSETDAANAEKSYTQSIIELSDLEKTREQLLNTFSVLIGEHPSYNFQRSDDVNFSGVIPTEISTEIIENRPDYVKAKLMVEKAGLDVRIARKEFLPTFNIAGLALFNAGSIGSTFTTTNSLLALGGGIFQPLFLGGARVANLRMKKAGYERILENYKKTNLIAMQEINDALVAIKRDSDKYDKTLRQLELSQKNYTRYEKQYEKGYISYLDLLQKEEVLLVTEKLVINQKTEKLIDYISLYKVTGAGL